MDTLAMSPGRQLTLLTSTAVWLPFEEHGQSVSGRLEDTINGEGKDYGLSWSTKATGKKLPIEIMQNTPHRAFTGRMVRGVFTF